MKLERDFFLCQWWRRPSDPIKNFIARLMIVLQSLITFLSVTFAVVIMMTHCTAPLGSVQDAHKRTFHCRSHQHCSVARYNTFKTSSYSDFYDNIFRQMAADIERLTEHCGNHRQHSVLTQGKALHWTLWRFRNCTRPQQFERRKVDCATTYH